MANAIAKPKFVHLRVHSEFSVKTGLMKISQILKLASEFEMPGVCVSDLNMFCGLIKLYEKSKLESLKPICSLDLCLRDKNGVLSEVTIFARNNIGYQNMCRILTKSYVRAHGKLSDEDLKEIYHITVNHCVPTNKDLDTIITEFEDLVTHAEGIICLVSSYNGLAGQYLRLDKFHDCLPVYQELKNVFGKYLFQGIARCYRPGEKELETYIIHLANKYKLPLVAVNDVLFAKQEDFFIHKLRVCIAKSEVLNNYSPNYTDQQYFKSAEEMLDLFYDLPQAIYNTFQICKLCTVNIKLGHHDLPRFHLDPKKENDRKLKAIFDEYKINHPDKKIDEEEWILTTLSYQGLEARLKFLYPDKLERDQQRPRYLERLEFELDIIKNMKFPGYFLIVQEFINWSKDKGIPVGPGRGSGAGSLVAYSLKITDLDPLKYALLFERFLNPARKSMPDFDVDFCNEGRGEVIKHMQEHYGRDSVSQIMTFGTMGAKGVVKDVARVLEIDRKKGEDISKAIQDKIQTFKVSDDGTEIEVTLKGNLENNIKYNIDFGRLYNSDDPDYKRIIDISCKLEGLVRQVGKHAAGIVISPTDMAEYSALYLSEDGEQSTHYDKDDIERVGLVKFDFLGLKNLTIINNACRMINQKHKRLNKKPFDINSIPLDDELSYKILQKGDTHGIFQLESTGITKYVIKAKPQTFEDIIAIIALYRPGPLQSGMVENYIKRKNGEEEVFYPVEGESHDCLKDVLDPTYGVIVYQEQVMQIAQVFSGYSLGEADNLRRAMGKKKAEVMAAERNNFVSGAVKNGQDEVMASRLFDLVDKFAGYGFNKSHSAAYALVSYQTAYLKAHYRAEFLAAVLTNAQSDISKIFGSIKDLNNPLSDSNYIKYLTPDVNTSDAFFYVNENNELVYSLAALKGIGEEVVGKIVKERNKNGLFKDFYDFIKRNWEHVSESGFRTLNYAGAFNKFIEQHNKDLCAESLNPGEVLHSKELYDALISPIITDCKSEKGFGLFDEVIEETLDDFINPELIKTVQSWSIPQELKNIYTAFNFYFDGHPLNEFDPERTAISTCPSFEALEEEFNNFRIKAIQDKKSGTVNFRSRKEFLLVAHLDFAKKDKHMTKGNGLTVELSDETGQFRNFYVQDNDKSNQILLDEIQADTKVVVRIFFGCFENKETNEIVVYKKITGLAPLQDVFNTCSSNIHAMVDVRNDDKIEKFKDVQQIIKQNINHNLDDPNTPKQFLELSYLTKFGVIKLPVKDWLPVHITRDLLSKLKYECGNTNITIDLDVSNPDAFFVRDYTNFRYSHA